MNQKTLNLCLLWSQNVNQMMMLCVCWPDVRLVWRVPSAADAWTGSGTWAPTAARVVAATLTLLSAVDVISTQENCCWFTVLLNFRSSLSKKYWRFAKIHCQWDQQACPEASYQQKFIQRTFNVVVRKTKTFWAILFG